MNHSQIKVGPAVNFGETGTPKSFNIKVVAIVGIVDGVITMPFEPGADPFFLITLHEPYRAGLTIVTDGGDFWRYTEPVQVGLVNDKLVGCDPRHQRTKPSVLPSFIKTMVTPYIANFVVSL